MPPLTLRQLNRATLARQMMLVRERLPPLRAIERLLGMQAQWRLDRVKDTATLSVEPFAPLSARTRNEVAAEAESLLRFAEPDARSSEVRLGA